MGAVGVRATILRRNIGGLSPVAAAAAAAAGCRRLKAISFPGTDCGKKSLEAAARGITGRIAATRCVRAQVKNFKIDV